MNRIQQVRPEKRTSPAAAFRLESGIFSPATGEVQHALFAPVHYERGYAYPLLVWLHSPGRHDERQLLRVMPLVSARNYAAVAPRGMPIGDLPRVDAPRADMPRGGMAAAGVTSAEAPAAGASEAELSARSVLDWPQSPAAIEESENRVFAAIQAAQEKFNIAPRRVFLAGFDGGGTMALRVAMNHPDRFAGVISLCGPLPQGHCPLGQVNRLRYLPMMISVAAYSRRYSPEAACYDLRLLHSAGVQLISLRQYSCEHALVPQMLGDVDRWIMERVSELRQAQDQGELRRSCPQD